MSPSCRHCCCRRAMVNMPPPPPRRCVISLWCTLSSSCRVVPMVVVSYRTPSLGRVVSSSLYSSSSLGLVVVAFAKPAWWSVVVIIVPWGGACCGGVCNALYMSSMGGWYACFIGWFGIGWKRSVGWNTRRNKKTDHDVHHGSFSWRTTWASHTLGPPLCFPSPIPPTSELEPPTSLWKGEGWMQRGPSFDVLIWAHIPH